MKINVTGKAHSNLRFMWHERSSASMQCGPNIGLCQGDEFAGSDNIDVANTALNSLFVPLANLGLRQIRYTGVDLSLPGRPVGLGMPPWEEPLISMSWRVMLTRKQL